MLALRVNSERCADSIPPFRAPGPTHARAHMTSVLTLRSGLKHQDTETVPYVSSERRHVSSQNEDVEVSRADTPTMCAAGGMRLGASAARAEGAPGPLSPSARDSLHTAVPLSMTSNRPSYCQDMAVCSRIAHITRGSWNPGITSHGSVVVLMGSRDDVMPPSGNPRWKASMRNPSHAAERITNSRVCVEELPSRLLAHASLTSAQVVCICLLSHRTDVDAPAMGSHVKGAEGTDSNDLTAVIAVCINASPGLTTPLSSDSLTNTLN